MRYALSFSAGIGAVTGFNYWKETAQAKVNQPKHALAQNHSFVTHMKEIKYSQPKIVELLHRSEQFHFLHNFIIQNERSALNFIKVYAMDGLEDALLDGTLQKMSEEEKAQNIKINIVFNASDVVQGHAGIVHGGLQATLIDNAFGHVSVVAFGLIPSATAYLNINYRKPVKTNQDYMISCSIDKLQGKKIFLRAKIVDAQGNIYTEADALFIKVNWGIANWDQFRSALEKARNS